jgi:hypothetical protein
MSVLEDLTNATMTFEKAKQEFEIRYYLWSISEFEKEIEESFPNLQLFKAGRVWRRYQFMRLLIKKEQMTLAHSFLKRWHRDTVKMLGEKISADEESLLSKYDGFFQSRQQYQYVQQLEKDGQSDVAHFWTQRLRAEAANIPSVGYFDNDKSLLSQLDAVFRLIPLTFEEQIAARKQTGEKIKFVSKRKLQKAMAEKFKAAFADQIIDFRFDDTLDPWSAFDLKCCGWILSTHFWFGRRESVIDYSQGISSPTRIKHPDNPEITGPAMLMGNGISWLCMNRWEYILSEEVEATCNDAMKLCGRFIEVAQKLLKGLEFEKITMK